MNDAELVELWRGGRLESLHRGHIAICNDKGEVLAGLGDPGQTIFSRSSCKMIQALPLVESGAELTTEQLALACASHQGAPEHVSRANAWLADLGLGDDDLRCGPQRTRDKDLYREEIREDRSPCRVHNNCSGKHAGFLTLTKRLGAGAEYCEIDHPVQQAVKTAFEEVTNESSPGFGIDGCSAPNHAGTVAGLAGAMARFATATDGSARGTAMTRLREAMMAHPVLVAGEGRACTAIMRNLNGRGAVKTGAEGVFVAILPERGLGVALKITDGATRASEAAIIQVLIGLGLVDAADPIVTDYVGGPIRNWDGLQVGETRATAELAALTL